MNKDFHYDVIKFLARAAGFDETDAQIIAYASQHVDDAIRHTPMLLDEENAFENDESSIDMELDRWLHTLGDKFELFKVSKIKKLVNIEDGKLTFDPICTAHKFKQELITGAGAGATVGVIIGSKGSKGDAAIMGAAGAVGAIASKAHLFLNKSTQEKVYISFHFIPDEMYVSPNDYHYVVKPGGGFATTLVQAVIQALREAENRNDRLTALVALGVALHTYADTWAHEGFTGRWDSDDNDLDELYINNVTSVDKAHHTFPDCGHGEADSYPDDISLGDLELRFNTGYNIRPQVLKRNNRSHFKTAASDVLEKLMEASGSTDTTIKDDIKHDCELIFKTAQQESKEDKTPHMRSRRKLDGIQLEYCEYEWLTEALNNGKDDGKVKYTKDGLWFKFHIAAAAQRAIVTANIKSL